MPDTGYSVSAVVVKKKKDCGTIAVESHVIHWRALFQYEIKSARIVEEIYMCEGRSRTSVTKTR